MTDVFVQQWLGMSKAFTQPALRINQYSADAFSRLTKLQTKCLEDCVETGVQQLHMLSDSESPEEFFAKETDALKDYFGRVQSYSREAMDIMMSTQSTVGEIMQEGLKSNGGEPAAKTGSRTAGAKSEKEGKAEH